MGLQSCGAQVYIFAVSQGAEFIPGSAPIFRNPDRKQEFIEFTTTHERQEQQEERIESSGVMAVTQELKLQPTRIPPLFRCPISLELMRDPVTLSTGLTYDRSSIEKWFEEGHRTCPATMQLVSSRELVPNHTLRRLIQEWCVANKSKGIERIPTPKQPLELHQARQMLEQLEERSSSGKQQGQIIRSLRSLARESEKNRKCIADAGAAPRLLQLISSWLRYSTSLISGPGSGEESECYEDAVGLLSILPGQLFPEEVDSKPHTIRSIITQDLLTALATMIGNKKNTVNQINAARLVERLASASAEFHEDMKLQIGSTPGLISGLVNLLRENSSFPRAVKASLGALFATLSSRKNWVRATECGAIPPLIELLPEASRQNTERALGILEFLSRCAEGRAAMAEHRLCVPVLVKIILTVSDVASERAVGILWAMSQADESVLRSAASEGAFTQMVLLIQADNSLQTSQRARELLKQLRSVVSQECLHDFVFTMPF